MICDSKKYIFTHIPKCGGTSVEHALLKYEGVDLYSESTDSHNMFILDTISTDTQNKYWLGNPDNKGPRQHLKSCEYDNNIRHYYNFTFVRNPYSKIVSEFMYFTKIYEHKKESAGFDPHLVNCLINHDFFAFVQTGVDFIWREHAEPQHKYTRRVDYIGRFETLQQDFDKICDRIGIPQQQLPHTNKTKHKHYTEYYDNKAKDLVTTRYQKDISQFEYFFGE